MANFSNSPRPRYITVTPSGEFKSLAKAAEAESVTPMAIIKKLNNSAKTSYYKKFSNGVIDIGVKQNRNYGLDRKTLIGTTVITPLGEFKTAKEAAEAESIAPCTITARIKNKNFPGYYRTTQAEPASKVAVN